MFKTSGINWFFWCLLLVLAASAVAREGMRRDGETLNGGCLGSFLGEMVAGKATVRGCYLTFWGDSYCELGNLQLGTESKDACLRKRREKLFFNFSSKGGLAFESGDLVSFEGVLTSMEGDWGEYLAGRGIRGEIKNDKGKMFLLLAAGDRRQRLGLGEWLELRVMQGKNWVGNRMEKLFQGEVLGLVRALILGDKSWMSQAVRDNFKKAGLAHVVAISGMHIAIGGDIFLGSFLGLGLRRRWAAIGLLLVLLIWVALIDFPASALRALLMGGLTLVGQMSGRVVYPLRNWAVCFLGMVIIWPQFFWGDIGFWLSFLAAGGIIVGAKRLESGLFFLPQVFKIREITAVSLAAQLATLPLVIKYFGYVPLLSVVANILTSAVLVYVLTLALLTVLISGLSIPAGEFLAVPVTLGSHYLLEVARVIANWNVGIEL